LIVGSISLMCYHNWTLAQNLYITLCCSNTFLDVPFWLNLITYPLVCPVTSIVSAPGWLTMSSNQHPFTGYPVHISLAPLIIGSNQQHQFKRKCSLNVHRKMNSHFTIWNVVLFLILWNKYDISQYILHLVNILQNVGPNENFIWKFFSLACIKLHA
jgi:hypothetical protein